MNLRSWFQKRFRSPHDEHLAQTCYNMGNQLVKTGQATEALEKYRQALEIFGALSQSSPRNSITI